MSQYTYATLGEACQVDASALTDNSKYLPVNNPDYNLVPTKFYQYPGDTYYPQLFVNNGRKQAPDYFREPYVVRPVSETSQGVRSVKPISQENYAPRKTCTSCNLK